MQEFFFLEQAGELRINILRREGCKETQSYSAGFCFGQNLYKIKIPFSQNPSFSSTET
jgi:hypothetical protein